jgi:CBS domain-containing protein
MLVKDLMSTNIISVAPTESTTLAAMMLARHNIGALPICSGDGKLKGIVTDRDIVLRCVAAESSAPETKVGEIMTRSVTTVSPNDDLKEATRLMSHSQVRRLPVVEDGHLVGILSLADLARNGKYDMEASRALSEISTNIRKG